MTYEEIAAKIELIKGNYQNGNIDGEEMCEMLDDLCCEIEECEDPFSMSGITDDSMHYKSFEETDFTELKIND